MQARIRTYWDGSLKHRIGALAYARHMEEAKRWNKAFCSSYAMGSVPPEFQGSPWPLRRILHQAALLRELQRANTIYQTYTVSLTRCPASAAM